jgi:hypothetical protein
VQPLYDEITSITDEFCAEYLNEEYAAMCRKLAAKLARKRPTPLSGGRRDIWAAAIVYTVGRVNFLFDKTQTPHLIAGELCQLFGAGKTTIGNKSTSIMKMLRIAQFDPEYTLPSRIDDHPYLWYILVNGFMVDSRRMPRDIQEEALRLGLIPYVPGERPTE